jgi:DNA repair protein RecN (Recombination protein N)
LEVVDEFAQIDDLKSDYVDSFLKLKKVISNLEELEQKKQKAREEQDYWSFQLKELKGLNLKEGELEELQSTFQRASNASKLAGHIGRIKEYLDGESVEFPNTWH